MFLPKISKVWYKVEFFKTSGEVKDARGKLEEATEKSFAKFAHAHRECARLAKRIILD